MICYLRYCVLFVLSVFLTISPLLQVVSFADVNDLLIVTGSNALMTMELDDSDYSVMPMSTFGSVSNTLWPSSVEVIMVMVNENTDAQYVQSVIADKVNGRYQFSWNAPAGYRFANFQIVLPADNGLPSPGTYKYSVDFASDFAITYDDCALLYFKSYKNAASVNGNISLSGVYQQYSGDYYIGDYLVDLTNVDSLRQYVHIKSNQSVYNIGGSFAIRFVKTSESGGASTGMNTSELDYQDDVSSSLSDLSSSVESVEEEISLVTQAIQTLQGAMEPHYDNVLTQLHHITEQLHAFYDQVYNNIHLPELNMLTQIKEAIENIDLQIEVDISEVKTAINNMSTAIQNKLQSVQDTITNGFDNAAINEDAAALDQQLSEYEDAEQNVLDQVNDSLNNFEFDSGFEEYQTTIQVFSQFLQDLYDSSGGFKIVINLSLMLSIAGVVIGIYRFRG